jgi:predicted nuclease with TOPRIM domain
MTVELTDAERTAIKLGAALELIDGLNEVIANLRERLNKADAEGYQLMQSRLEKSSQLRQLRHEHNMLKGEHIKLQKKYAGISGEQA